MPSKFLFSLLPCVRKEETESSFLKNGSILLEDLIASCDGKSSPIRTYSADELVKATNNFDPSFIISDDSSFKLFRGLLDDRSIIIKKYLHWPSEVEARSMAICDIIISMQMSTHKNALKLSGCCLEFSLPALVHEDAAKGALNCHGGLVDTRSLPWKTRQLIAMKVAHALAYLHTAFPRPIIHRYLKPTCIFLDDDNSPKLSDFSPSITIPPTQFHVEDVVIGTYKYADPTYIATGYITEKTDVYSFGVLLLVFLMGRKIGVVDKSAAVKDLTSYVDANILRQVRADEQAQQQLQAFLALALLCTQDERESRPCMTDVLTLREIAELRRKRLMEDEEVLEREK